MRDRNHSSLFYRLRKTKAALLAVSLTLAGILIIMFNGWIQTLDLHDWKWLASLPLGEIGGTLFGAGLLGTLFEYSFRKDQLEATAEQFRNVIKEQAPAMRDAVIEGFAVHPEDLERITKTDYLDDIASNVSPYVWATSNWPTNCIATFEIKSFALPKSGTTSKCESDSLLQ